ncbi:MAG: GNAT family N-acetyltransferase [Phycisphaerae bacterium]
MVFHFGERAYYYQSGWDPAAAALSPGMLCLARAIRVAIEEGLCVFDFLRGSESYKSHWTQTFDETVCYSEPVSLAGRMLLRADTAKNFSKRCLVRLAGPQAWRYLRAGSLSAARRLGLNGVPVT